MKLTIMDEALEQLRLLQIEGHPILRLYYDIEGCGCGVNGVRIMYFTNEITQYDEVVENDQYKIVIDEQQKTFFEPEMKLEWTGRLFRLKSPNQMLNASLSSRVIQKGVEFVE